MDPQTADVFRDLHELAEKNSRLENENAALKDIVDMMNDELQRRHKVDSSTELH